MDKFTSIGFITSYGGMILTVIMLTQIFKKLFDKVIHNKTKFVVAIFSLALCALAASILGDFSSTREIVNTSVVWFINAGIVWLASMKAFESITEPDSKTLKIYTKGNTNYEYTQALNTANKFVDDYKVIKIKKDQSYFDKVEPAPRK